MSDISRWAVGSNQYMKRPGQQKSAGHHRTEANPPSLLPRQSDRQLQEAACAISWDTSALDFDSIQHSTVERSRHRFRATLPDLVWNAARLEGNTFTLPEVRTLLEGVTVGGKRIEDANQVLALSEGYSRIDELVGAGAFELSKPISDEVHSLVAVHEAIESGHFRGEGQVSGGGSVHLSNGGSTPGFEHGLDGELLIARFERTTDYLSDLDDPRERALAYFASATRQQFYFDGNKRTSRLMMSGELMMHGYDVVSVPARRQFEFNTSLDVLFSSNDATPLMAFLISCATATEATQSSAEEDQ